MRHSASDKTEIIRLVEQSHLPARRTLEKLGIPRSSFYRWYDRYQRRTGSPRGSTLTAGSGGGSHPRGYPQPDCRFRINPNLALGKWRCASRTRQNTLSQGPRSIGC